MKILIGQPVHEEGITQLENDVKNNKGINVVLYPEGYLSGDRAVEEACKLAKQNNVMIITSHKKDNKNRAIIIGENGNIIYERAKTLPDEAVKLVHPLYVQRNKVTMGYLLCMEILKGYRDLKTEKITMDFIFHPIGVGMFSDEQFELWLNEAKKIAKTFNTIILGTSHADGSYRNCGTSIPISYCIDNFGEAIYISKSDLRARIVDMDTKAVSYV